MTVVAVLADPPRPGLVLPELASSSPLTESEAADLYAAMLRDVCTGVERSGGDLLVNYRPDDLLPDEHRTSTSAGAEVRAVVAETLADVGAVRFEPQVGSTLGARAGNTITHLLREDGVDSVAVVRPNAPFLSRPVVDSAAMKLRRSPVVLGPAPGGRVHYAAFTDPVDFEGSFAPPELPGLAERAREAGHDVDFVPMFPVVERGGDLVTALSLLQARVAADRTVPVETADCLASLGLDLTAENGRPRLTRTTDTDRP